MRQTQFPFGIILTIGLWIVPQFTQAAGFLYVGTQNNPSAWSELVIHPESGTCGPFNNAETIALLEDAILAWQNLDEVDLNYSIVEGEIPDVDFSNYQDYIITGSSDSDESNATDNIIPIIFDDDGTITEALMGSNAQYLYLGLTSINNFSDANLEILSEGQMILNCRCIEGHLSLDSCNDTFSGSEAAISQFQSTLVHEMGHLLNLGHSIANEEFAGDSNASDAELLATMYPYVYPMETPFEVTQDDIVAIASVYPANNFAENYCLVTGTLLDSEGGELECANVVASSSDDSQTVTFVTGSLANNIEVSNNSIVGIEDCTENCGDFQFYLIPDTSYTISVTTIDEAFTGASSVGPCADEQASNIVAQTPIATITSSSCTAGTLISLGNITTESPPESSGSTDSGTDSTDDSDTTDTTDDSETSGDTTSTRRNQVASQLPGACSLTHTTDLILTSTISFFAVLASPLFVLFLLRFKNRFVNIIVL